MLRYFLLALAAVVSVASTPASADDFVPGAFFTATSEGWAPTYRNGDGAYAPKTLSGGSIGAGWRFNRFYTVEAGYGYVTGSTSIVRISPQRLSLDGMGFLPIGHSTKFALFSDIGASAVFAHYVNPIQSGNVSTYDPHIGGGAQFQFNEMFGLRALLQYQWLGYASASGAVIASVGLVFRP